MRLKASTKAGAALSGMLAGLLLLQSGQAGQSVLRLPVQPPRAAPIPLAPAHGTIPGWLHTDGTWIVDAQNRHVHLTSVNWDGALMPVASEVPARGALDGALVYLVRDGASHLELLGPGVAPVRLY